MVFIQTDTRVVDITKINWIQILHQGQQRASVQKVIVHFAQGEPMTLSMAEATILLDEIKKLEQVGVLTARRATSHTSRGSIGVETASEASRSTIRSRRSAPITGLG